MKIRFITDCTDKFTAERYRVQQVKEFDDDRAAEIIQTGCAEAVIEQKKEPKAKKAPVTDN